MFLSSSLNTASNSLFDSDTANPTSLTSLTLRVVAQIRAAPRKQGLFLLTYFSWNFYR